MFRMGAFKHARIVSNARHGALLTDTMLVEENVNAAARALRSPLTTSCIHEDEGGPPQPRTHLRLVNNTSWDDFTGAVTMCRMRALKHARIVINARQGAL